ncbi:MAG: hypothetical protein SGJ10_03425 [Bacteroidota bacterium]|nr:hypothetical protein [Bacteroidota bacterium]
MYYNYYCNGHLSLDSYQQEGFIYKFSPFIATVAFSPNNGLFCYAPILLVIFGFTTYKALKKEANMLFPTLLILFYIYLYASWSSYNLGCSVGHRAFTDIMPLLSVPIAAIIYSKRRYLFIPTFIVLVGYTTMLTIVWPGSYFGNSDWNWEWLWNFLITSF